MPAATPCDCDAPACIERDLPWLRHFVSESRTALCRRIAPRIPSDVRGLIDADDVLQEAYIDLFRHARSITTATDAHALRRWLARIALHRLQDAVRVQRAVKRGGLRGWKLEYARASAEDIPADAHAPAAAADSDLQQSMDRVLAKLPDSQRTALKLLYAEGQSLAEAASRMGRTPGAVRTLCYKARKALRLGLGTPLPVT